MPKPQHLTTTGILAGLVLLTACTTSHNATQPAIPAPTNSITLMPTPPPTLNAPASTPTITHQKTQAEQFKAFVNKHGTPTEKTVTSHVTKVQGSETQTNTLDIVDIWTTYTGGFASPHASDAQLIATAFADWKHSKNGIVTIYDKHGEIITIGNF